MRSFFLGEQRQRRFEWPWIFFQMRVADCSEIAEGRVGIYVPGLKSGCHLKRGPEVPLSHWRQYQKQRHCPSTPPTEAGFARDDRKSKELDACCLLLDACDYSFTVFRYSRICLPTSLRLRASSTVARRKPNLSPASCRVPSKL